MGRICIPHAARAQENAIRVEIEQLHSDRGQVVCALYASAEGFPKDTQKAIAHATSLISNRTATCDFSGMVPGLYADRYFTMRIQNGKLDTNFLGIPREGVGASNGARGHLGPPKFDAAAFHFSRGRLDLKITIAYL